MVQTSYTMPHPLPHYLPDPARPFPACQLWSVGGCLLGGAGGCCYPHLVLPLPPARRGRGRRATPLPCPLAPLCTPALPPSLPCPAPCYPFPLPTCFACCLGWWWFGDVGGGGGGGGTLPGPLPPYPPADCLLDGLGEPAVVVVDIALASPLHTPALPSPAAPLYPTLWWWWCCEPTHFTTAWDGPGRGMSQWRRRWRPGGQACWSGRLPCKSSSCPLPSLPIYVYMYILLIHIYMLLYM